MSDQMAPRIVVAALLSLLTDALDRPETRHLSNDVLLKELQGLRVRVEGELKELAGENRLRVAGDSEELVGDD